MDAIELLDIVVKDIADFSITGNDTVFHIVGVNAGALGKDITASGSTIRCHGHIVPGIR